MSAKPQFRSSCRFRSSWLFSLFLLLGLAAMPAQAATLTVTSPGTITTDSRPGITVSINGSTTGDTVLLSLQGGGGTLSSTGTGGSSGGNNTVVTSGDGVYIFTSAHITKPGTAYTLTAAVTAGPDTGTTGTSAAFMVTPGAAAKIVLGQQPTATPSGARISPAVSVLVEDADGNLVSTSSAPVAVTLSGTPTAGGSAALSGTTPVNAVGGVATFSDLRVDKAGTAYTLNMTSAGLTPTASTTFAVTAGAAAAVAFVQQPSGAASGASITPPITVQVVDAASNPVSGVAVALALTAGTGTLSGGATQLTDGTGTATFAGLSVDRAGAGKQLTATSGSASPATSSTFTVTAGTPTAIAFAQQPSGAASGAAVTPPVVVRVTDAATNAVSGVIVALSKSSGPGTVGGTLTQTTDANGNATFSTLHADLVGSYRLTATDAADSLTVDSSAFTITAGPTATLSFSQQPATGASFISGAAITPVYKVLAADAASNPVSGVAVALALTAGTGTLSGGATQLTDGTGTATFAGLSVDRAGAGKQLTATSGSASPATSSTFTVTAGTPTAIAFAQQPGNAASGASIAPPVVVHVVDAAGNPAPGVTVGLSKKTGPGTVSGTAAQTTDASGNATFSALSANRTGSYQLTATDAADSLTVDSSAFTITAGAAAILSFSQQPATGASFISGAAITPVYKVLAVDASGNVVPGVAVTLTLTAGTGTLSGGATQLTDGTGTATFAGLSVDRAGTGKQLTATSGSASPALSNTFTVTAGTPTAIGFAVQPTNASPNAPITPAIKVQVLDAAGNPVSGVSVALSLSGTSAAIPPAQTTDAAGIATFASVAINAAGTYQLTAKDAADGLTVASSIFTITTGTAASMAFSAQPTGTTAGSPLTPPVVVHVTDSATNAVAGVSVTLTKKTGPGTVSGTLTQTTDASGNATFGNLSANLSASLANAYQLTASSGSLPPVDSNPFTITAAAAANIAFATQPTNTASGAAINPAVVLKVTDTFGNAVAGAAVALTLAPGSTGILSGTAVQTTDSSGNATFSGLTINLAGVKQLTATTGSLTVNSSTFTITPGPATQTAFTVQPSGAASGASIAPPVVVQVLDAAGNPAPGVSVALTKKSGPGIIGGLAARLTDVNGNATFSALRADLVGSYQLTATGTTADTPPVTLPPVDSSAFTITTGAAASIAFAQPPTSTVSGVPIAPPVVVHLQDAAGNPLPSVPVTLTLSGGAGALSGAITQPTDASGNATFNNLSVNKVGTNYTLTAAAAGLTIASGQFAIAPAAPATLSFTTQPSGAASGATIAPPVVVHAADNATNAVGGVSVTLTKKSGLGIVGGTLTQTTDADGNATFSTLHADLVGPYKVTATDAADSLTVDSSAFSITAAGVANVALTGPPVPATQTTDGTFKLTALVTDSAGNEVANATVSLTLVNASDGSPATVGLLTGGTAVSDINGNASFILKISKVGVYQLIAVSGGVPSAPSASVTIIVGTPANLAFAVQPTSVSPNTAIVPSVVVTLTDISGNPVTGSVISLALSNGTGILGGQTSAATDGSGRATFSGLSINRSGAKQITATAGTLSVASSVFTVSTGAPSLSFVAQSGGTSSVPSPITAGVAIAPSVQVQLQDAAGNPFPGSSVTLTLTKPDGNAVAAGVSLGGTTTVATDATGVATFSSLTVNKVGTYLLVANAVPTQGSTTATVMPTSSSQFMVVAGPVANIAFTGQPQNTALGAALTPAVVLTLTDALGNLVPGASVTVGLAAGSTGTLSIARGSLTLNTGSDGTATFTGLSINTPGQKQLVATATPSTSTALGTSNPFTIGNAKPSGVLLLNVGKVHAGDGSFILTISGNSFVVATPTSPASTVTFDGTVLPASAVTVSSDSSGNGIIAAAIPANLVTAAKTVVVTVTNPSGVGGASIVSDNATFSILPLGPTADTSGKPHGNDSDSNPVQHFDAGLQLFSVPFDYTGRMVDPVLADLTVPGLVDMMSNGILAVWDPAKGSYDLTDQSNAATNAASSLVLGQGYWARFAPTTTSEVGLKTRGLEAKSLTDGRFIAAQNLFQIPLKAGWNMIGDPFLSTIVAGPKLSEIQVQVGAKALTNTSAPISLEIANNLAVVSDTFYDYVGGAYVPVARANGGRLVPYVGYWVLAYQPCTLLVPSP